MAQGPLTISALHVSKSGGFKVAYTTSKSISVVISTIQSRDIGWAVFDIRGEVLVEAMAVIAPDYRGLGVYTALLRLLKVEVGPVVLSDKKLSVANAIQWMRHGAYDPDSGRMRLNPRRERRTPTRRHVEQAIFAIYTRDATK
jgi:hypothetical protein